MKTNVSTERQDSPLFRGQGEEEKPAEEKEKTAQVIRRRTRRGSCLRDTFKEKEAKMPNAASKQRKIKN